MDGWWGDYTLGVDHGIGEVFSMGMGINVRSS
jgi:hypothetical protein